MRKHRTLNEIWLAQIQRAEAALSAPPPEGVERPEPRGEVVAQFVLELEHIRPQNRTRHNQAWQLEKIKKAVRGWLTMQNGGPHRQLMKGRPQVLCVRFSSVQPDKYNDGFKFAVDALCAPRGRRKHGLGFFEDDSPKHIDLHQWWEKAPPRQGFGYIEIRTGEANHGS